MAIVIILFIDLVDLLCSDIGKSVCEGIFLLWSSCFFGVETSLFEAIFLYITIDYYNNIEKRILLHICIIKINKKWRKMQKLTNLLKYNHISLIRKYNPISPPNRYIQADKWIASHKFDKLKNYTDFATK